MTTPVTKRGKREMRDVAKILDRRKCGPHFIVTSPLPRAAQTAEIAADYLKPRWPSMNRSHPDSAEGNCEHGEAASSKRPDACRPRPEFTKFISGLSGASSNSPSCVALSM